MGAVVSARNERRIASTRNHTRLGLNRGGFFVSLPHLPKRQVRKINLMAFIRASRKYMEQKTAGEVFVVETAVLEPTNKLRLPLLDL